MSAENLDAVGLLSVSVTRKRREKELFLCAKSTTVLGRSTIASAYPHTRVQPIAEKFYSKYKNEPCINENELKKFIKKLTSGPREKYKEPVLESHEYGWLNHIRFDIAADYRALLENGS